MKEDRIGQVAQRGILTLLLATVLVVPLLCPPDLWAWRGVKPILFEVINAVLERHSVTAKKLHELLQRRLAKFRGSSQRDFVLTI